MLAIEAKKTESGQKKGKTKSWISRKKMWKKKYTEIRCV